MKRVFNILSFAFFLLVLTSCGNVQLDMPNEDTNQSNGPIMEFAVNVGSRAAIMEGGAETILDKLGLYGYQYANQTGSNWATAKVTALPTVFDQTPEPLTYNTTDKYYGFNRIDPDPSDDEVPGPYTWTGQKYSFFAHYPFEHSSFTKSSRTEPNTPYLTYTVDRSDVTNMADIMTSARTDLTAVNRYVTFHMIHRLSAVDVDICNIYQHEETTGEGESTETTQENIEIEIHSLVLKFSNLHYDSSKIYLDAEVSSVQKEAEGEKSAEYTLVTSTKPVTVPYKEDDGTENYHLTTADNRNQSMFFIPQAAKDLQVSVDIQFKKKRTDNTYLTNEDKVYTYDNDGNLTNVENAKGFNTKFFYVEDKSVNFEQSLDEGYRYYITLNFTSAAVSINIVTAAQWEDSNVKHEFD